MKSISFRRRTSSFALLPFALACIAGAAYAQAPPTKNVKIYNNSSTETIYPVLAAYVGGVDLWMQAQFKDNVTDVNSQTFCNTDPAVTACNAQTGVPRLYRAYVNPNKGIPPGQFVSITVPFYTQLVATTPATIGRSSGQYIDWWNAQRIFLYDGATAIAGAYNYNVDQNGNIVPPTPVSPLAGATVPSCASDNMFTCEPVVLLSYIGVYPTGSIPFQLVEYTFGAAEGPPPGGLLPAGSPLSIDLLTTNFNISAVDGIYLPVAMAVVVDPSDPNYPTDSQYLGTVAQVAAFRSHLQHFIQNGPLLRGGPRRRNIRKLQSSQPQWPFYFPSYFSAAQPTVAHTTPQDGDAPYPLPSIPSANVVFAESYKNPAPAPPVLSSDTNGTPMLGATAQAMVALWTRCTTTGDPSLTCQQIRSVFDFFSRNYSQTCGLGGPLPDTPTMMTQVYGWAEFPGCSHALVDTPGYDTAIADFCTLQYNYLTSVKQTEVFNPYTALVHGTLGSNAYAFSIDDKAAFKSVPSNELIVTIGGAKGLISTNQTPLPNAKTFQTYCH